MSARSVRIAAIATALLALFYVGVVWAYSASVQLAPHKALSLLASTGSPNP